MRTLDISDIIAATGGRLEQGKTGPISGISTDSRTINEGELFVAIKGDDYDGHDFIKDALSKGAAGAVVSSVIGKTAAIVRVEDTLKALGDIAAFYRKRFDLPVVAITGSAGKTTTKDILSNILSVRYRVLSNTGTENNIIGVSRTIMKLEPGFDICVLELGTNHFGEIKRLSEISSPTSAVFTNIGPSHLEFLKDEEGVFRAKTELLENVRRGGRIYINKDDKYLSRIERAGTDITGYGINSKADFTASGIIFDWKGSSFVINGEHRFTISGLGSAGIYNALAAIACARGIGLDWKEIEKGLAGFKSSPMRMELLRYNGMTVINDSYNANPLSMKNAVDTLSALSAPSRKVLLLADMLELGDNRAEFHRDTGRAVAAAKINVLITIGELASDIASGASRAGMDKGSIHSFKNNKDFAAKASSLLKGDDTILMKGSRLMKMEDLLECFTVSCTV